MTARVIFHLPEAYADRYHTARHLALFPAIEAVILRRGGQVAVAPPAPVRRRAKAAQPDDNLHIAESGRIRRRGFLNAALAYLPGFWHLDPAGVLADSSLAGLRFDPGAVDGAKAAAFFQRLRRDFALARRSRYGQPVEVLPVPDGAIVVFLQGPKPQRRGQAHMGYAEMLATVARGAQGRPVLAKPHPLQPELGRQVIAEVQASGLAVTETVAHVHDLLAAAAVSVSVNSAAAIEGFLHGTPAVLFGRSDFAQMVETVTEAGGFPAALQRALTTPRDYPRWFQWYFAQNCLEIAAEDFEPRLMAILARAGFDAGRLGLT